MSSRIFNRTMQLGVDLGVLAVAYVLAYVVRFEGAVPAHMARTLAWTLPYVVAVQYALLVGSGAHRFAWRYISLPDVTRIAAVAACSAALLVTLRFALKACLPTYPLLVRAIVPVGVGLVDGTFAFIGVTGVRVLRRLLAERAESGSRAPPRLEPVPTMLIGAGRAGVLVAKEIAARPDLGILPVGFVDDDPVKLNMVVHGVPVLGSTAQLAELCTQRSAKQALITMAAAPGKDIRRITTICEQAGIPVKIVPGVFEIVGGRVNLSRIRKVEIDDLLRRDPITLDEDAIAGVVRDRVVLVTGAGGSIGSELCRQIGKFKPRALVLVEHSENGLFAIERELRGVFPELSIHPVMGDIRDRPRMEGVLTRAKPHVVFHAAAHKHVPMMEANPGEAVKNNVLGTKILAELADALGVAEFVMISTDKAVNPTSVMGATKRAAEIYVQALSQRSSTRFVAVRFGNVLGSAGSVVPIFQDQIARGGPVTVTHPDMRRYFMTIPEACQLVLQAGALGRGGEIFVLDMGEPVKVVDLARDLIALSGLREGEDIEIEFTGVRPGEKLFEELSLAEEGAERTGHPKVFIGRIKPHAWETVRTFVQELERAATQPDGQGVKALLARYIPEYCQQSNDGAAVIKSAAPRAEQTTPAQPSNVLASASTT